MLYLLDANVLIDANRDYYPLERVPEFWDWLQHAGAAGDLKVPLEIYDEITAGSGDLVDWLKQREIKRDLVFNEDPDPDMVDRVVNTGYAPDLTDLEVNKVGRDPFLIAYVLASATSAGSSPTKLQSRQSCAPTVTSRMYARHCA